ncbi:tetratricopeptide repeat protein [Sphingomicrobium lutaoense]|uniref:Flp pilus assembly protein TadD n=1 Tax=Sphingomicrobium lutaoense TaxID=515949 RepID=A0A839Z1K1_9SPHN|nr:tetratricopeptide repeat protein [Sphingomicrobium lutaoense]MBB3763552.1 Flp pilus assembly protein TadD [Sphingomicrobium lutaoense]
MTNHRMKQLISGIALAAALGACATPASRQASIFGGKVDESNIGLATRAQAALVAEQYDEAIALAERAVEKSPHDAGFRTLLGNAYFAAGRFTSAEAAYGDSLALVPAQPQVILKRALVLIAQGRPTAAVALLDMADGFVDEADHGLALALAGRPDSAVAVLGKAARRPGADARTRQNLALAHALAGDWQQARAVAAQDVPANQIDARMEQWMRMAKPTHPSQQVAELTGIAPAALDPGQPVRLVLRNDDGQRLAVALPAEPVPYVAPGTKVAAKFERAAPAAVQTVSLAPMPVAPTPPADVKPVGEAHVRVMELPVVDVDLEEDEDELAPLAVAEAAAVPAPQPVPAAPTPKPAPKPALVTPVQLAAAPVAKAADPAPKPALSAATTRLTQSARSIRAEAARVKGESRSVVQLGAYTKRSSLDLGWQVATRRFSPVREYKPMAARTTVDGQKFYRLAAYGFTSDADARNFCGEVRAAGGECFVRKMAGDTPFKLASR